MATTLTSKQARFVEEYLVDLNASAAARRAGYSERVANRIGAENLSKPDISAAIAAALKARTERVQVDADWVLRRLHKEATADLAGIFDEQGRLRQISEWPDVFRRGLVVSVESFEEYAGRGEDRTAIGMVRKVKLSDRIKHIELIGKHVDVAAFRERVEVDAGGSLLELIAASMKPPSDASGG